MILEHNLQGIGRYLAAVSPILHTVHDRTTATGHRVWTTAVRIGDLRQRFGL